MQLTQITPAYTAQCIKMTGLFCFNLKNFYSFGNINRWDVSVPKEAYLKDKHRTLIQLEECAKQKTSILKLGVLNQPLIKIDLEQANTSLY